MIRIENLAAGYGNKTLFSRFSFSLNPGDSPLVLAGRNGSGKSTLLRILAGFRKPETGTVAFEKNRSNPAWLPQHFRMSLEIPVLDFVAMGTNKPGKWLFSRPESSRENSLLALEKLGISRLANQATNQLSGGEWQLVCLAQMLAQDTDTWLLDEPTASLDIAYKRKVLDLLWAEAASGKTIVFSTHDLPFLPETGGRLLLVNESPQVFANSAESRKTICGILEKF